MLVVVEVAVGIISHSRHYMSLLQPTVAHSMCTQLLTSRMSQ